MKTTILVYEFISAGGLGDTADGSAEQAALLAQGISMRDALLADLHAEPRFAASIAAATEGAAAGLPPALASCPSVQPLRGETAAAFLARVAPDFDRVWVVAPETGGILGALCEAVGPVRWVGCERAAIALCSSKAATRHRLAAHGLAVPAAWPAQEADAEAAQPDGAPPERTGTGGRWVVKPDDGAGSEDTRVFDDFAAARADATVRLARGRPTTLEAWVDGEALSLSLHCTTAGAALLGINRQHLVVGPGGELRYEGVSGGIEPLDGDGARAFARLAAQVHAAAPGLRGFVGIDLVRTADGRLVVIEINPRLTCAYAGLSARLGRNVAAAILGAEALAAASRPSFAEVADVG